MFIIEKKNDNDKGLHDRIFLQKVSIFFFLDSNLEV